MTQDVRSSDAASRPVKDGDSRPSTLRILPENAPLRRGGPFLRPMEWQDGDAQSAPRALRGLARIIEHGLCHRCGSCVGICPTSVLGLDGEDYPRVANLSACTDCDLCVKVCPGDDFDYTTEHGRVFGEPGVITSTHGFFRSAALAHAADPVIREHSTSGGMVTALLLSMLETGAIDGAIIVGSHDRTLWKGQPRIARSREEILTGMKSKYAISPTNVTFAEVRTVPGRYAFVGLPCQVHGLRKAAALDERIRERIVVTIGLFCHAAIEHEAFRVIWDSLGERGARARRFVSRVGKHPGSPMIELDDGTVYPVYFGDRKGYRPHSTEVLNILYRLYTPERCTTCFDALSDLADISVGDPWMPPPEESVNFLDGWSFVMLRTERGEKMFRELVSEGKIGELSVTRREALGSNKVQAVEKRWRAFRVIETHRRQGKAVPRYGPALREFPRHKRWQFVKTELLMFSHILCFVPRLRAPVLRFVLGGGYWLLWLNNKRRTFRFWLRDTAARVQRSMLGRR